MVAYVIIRQFIWSVLLELAVVVINLENGYSEMRYNTLIYPTSFVKPATHLLHFVFCGHFIVILQKNNANAKTGQNNLYTLLVFRTIFFSQSTKKDPQNKIPLMFRTKISSLCETTRDTQNMKNLFHKPREAQNMKNLFHKSREILLKILYILVTFRGRFAVSM